MEQKNVVIVGAGMAGLTAAAYLGRENCNVLVLDKNNRIGGLLSSFEQDGFLFDSGPRALVNSGMVTPMFKDLGIEYEFLENTLSIGIEDEMFRIESMDSLKDYEAILCRLYPDNVDDIHKIIPVMRKLSKYTEILYEFDNPNFIDFTNNTAAILRKMTPWFFKFLWALMKMRQFNFPMEEHMARLTSNRSLHDIILQSFFRKMPSYFALGYFYVYLDYFYPKGGTGTLAKLLEQKALDGGVKIKLDTKIVEVNPSKSEVIDENGNTYPYDKLIWAADLKTLYQQVNTSELETAVRGAIDAEKEKIFAAKGAESVFMLFAGIDRPPSYFKEHGGEHLFYSPSRQGLGETLTTEREKLLAEFDNKSKEEVLEWLDQFLSLNTFEVSVPALRDPSLAPEGKTGLMISCLFDYDLIKKVRDAGWYDEFKQHLEQKVFSLFSQTLYKDIDQDILFKYSSSPLTVNKISGSTGGAITGWSFETEIPVVYTLKDITKSALTAIPNIYKAGQFAYCPAGVPIAMLTGWYATQEIVK